MTKKNHQNSYLCLVFLFLLLLVGACQNDAKVKEEISEQNPSIGSTETSEVTTVEPLKTKDLLFAWVDKLNIRDKVSTKGKGITTVNRNDALEFTGEKSQQNEEIVLRGVAYDAPWLKVITPDKKEGWVYGGAVKKEGEEKGNAELTATKFAFPHFGDFDLST